MEWWKDIAPWAGMLLTGTLGALAVAREKRKAATEQRVTFGERLKALEVAVSNQATLCDAKMAGKMDKTPAYGTAVPWIKAPVMTILLVEDNSDDVMLMRRSIRPAQQRFAQEGRQLHLVTVGTADEAESWLARNDPPACIVLDLGLPKKDGRQFLRELRLSEEWNTIPVVVATISDAFRERESAVNADAFWTKPVDLSRVVAAVDEGRLGCAAR